MKTRTGQWLRGIAVVVVVITAFGLGFTLRGGAPPQQQSTAGEKQATLWTCSMHPQIQMPAPGQCPICGMDLIPLETSSSDASGPRTLVLSPNAAEIAEVRTTPVVRHPVEARLRMVGKLEPDEGRVREISAWVPGRIERLFIDTTGFPVKQGEPLFEIYSPELYSAQEELLQALKSTDDLRRSSLESTRRSATRTVEASRERLRLWGLTAEQIRDIETRGTALERIVIRSPMSGIVLHKAADEGSYVKTGTHIYAIADLSVLWLQLDVYEADVSWIALDQKVEFTTEAYPGEGFDGRVSFIDPVLDERSRSVKVRVDVENPDGRLKPGMFAHAVVHATLSTEQGQPPMVIPRSAPLITGTRAVVYVADPQNPGRYEGREILLGREAGDVVVVREGLQVGELVVSHGAFKIDSALQIQAKTSMMNPDGGRVATGHQHGGSVPQPAAGKPAPPQPLEGVPAGFRQQLEDFLLLYFQVADGLSHDDLSQSRNAAGRIPEALRRPDAALLTGTAHDMWDAMKHDTIDAAEELARAKDMEQARDAFHGLSQRTIHLVRMMGASGSTDIFVYHCPMARSGAGADWLQPSDGVENPYYGSQMFRCGERTETLVESSATGPQNHPDPGSGHEE